MEVKIYMLGLSLMPGIGPVRGQKLLDKFNEPRAVWFADAKAWRDKGGLAPALIGPMEEFRCRTDIVALYKSIIEGGTDIVTLECEEYPPQLKTIVNPPLVLYIRGIGKALAGNLLSVVGTRKPSAYGLRVGHNMVGELARFGWTIVSGLAMGIDALAHNRVLEVDGVTIGVLGAGFENIYPRENKMLAERILSKGALVSEYPPWAKPYRGRFPARNRIISGLSSSLIVIEAPSPSGALITARLAFEQGRKVFIVPGDIYRHQNEGSNSLLNEGAIPLLSSRSLLEHFSLKRVSQDPLTTSQNVPIQLSLNEKLLLKALEEGEGDIESLLEKTLLPPAVIQATLLGLELKNLVSKQVGQVYYKV